MGKWNQMTMAKKPASKASFYFKKACKKLKE